MARYRFRDGRMVNVQTGEPLIVPPGPLATPRVVSDIPEYASPIDGRMITSRSERRYDLESNNCVEWEPSLSPTKGRIRNERFAKKWGLEVSEEFRK